MKVEQKSYAQILILGKGDFIFSHIYHEYEAMCPFMCFPGIVAWDFRASLKKHDGIVRDKDVIMLLEDYWELLAPDERKAILDHELGHISSGHLKAIEEKIKQGRFGGTKVDQTEEMEADAYSANLNGKKAMHHGLIKALEVIVLGAKQKGQRVTISQVIDHNPIIKNRLQVLAAEEGQSS